MRVQSVLLAPTPQQQSDITFDLQVVSGHLRTVCAGCGSSLENTQPPGDICQSLEVFKNVAQFHSFDLLAEVTSWLLGDPTGFL